MKRSLSSLIIACTLLASPVLADMPAPKIAVVNIQGIMRDATAAKSVRDQMQAKQKAYQGELTKKQDDLQKQEQELSKQRGVLAKDAFEAKVKDFRTQATNAQKDVEAKKTTLDTAFENAIAQIQKAVEGIIADLAKEKGFTLAVPTSQLLFADPSLDISAEVLQRLNSQLPKVDVKFSAPAAPKKDEKK